MQNSKWQRFFAATLIAAMLVGSIAPAASAAVEVAPIGVTAGEVTGEIAGGEFAKIWLGLTPTQPGATVTVLADWDRMDALANGLGFYILSPENLASVQGGNDIRDNNLSSGGPVFQGSSNQQIATFNATGGDYTLVIYNDSNSDAKFTVTATNALISDDSGQVMSDAEVEEVDALATTAPAATATPAAVTATTAATTTTTTTTAAVATATPAPATAPATTGQPTVVKAIEMKGSLPTEGSQDFLGLTPTDKDGEINLTMTFDPQDNQELARRIGFWVLDEQGFQRHTQGTPASQLAIAAGSRTFLGESNERKATFSATGFGPYTVIVYNNSNVPATYSLRVDGGILVDDSGQTETARATAGVTGTVTTTTAPVAATTTTTPTTAAATTTAATTAAAAATTGAASQPGGTHTIRAGDSLSALARDIYGDIQLYDEICNFNNITNCDLVEVGDVIKLPTRAQISAGISAPATTTAATTAAAPATTTAAPAATTTVTRTATTTTTTSAAPTTPVTRTATTTTTTTTRPATGQDIVSVANTNGNFTIFVKALQATGLDKTLQGGGPFTIFAPTDAAFEALGTATVDALLKDTNQLTQILKFHVVPDRIASSGITNGLEAATVLGSPVEFTVSGSNVKVQDSNVVVPDVAASNGVIHVIDKVMLPPAP